MKEYSLNDVALMSHDRSSVPPAWHDILGAAARRLADQQARIAHLEQLVETDELTGLVNRRGFTRRLRQAIADARRRDCPGLVIYCDLDDFKVINDRHGHGAGDAVLRQLAALLCGRCRAEDTVARLGGDEFAILMPHTGWVQGWNLARSLEHAIDRSHALWRGRLLPMTASIGVIGFCGDAPPETVLDAADRAMYRRKGSRQSTRQHTTP